MTELARLLIQLSKKHRLHAMATIERIALVSGCLVPCGLEFLPNILNFHWVGLAPCAREPSGKVKNDSSSFGEAGRPVSNPLAGDEDWETDEKFVFYHLERRGVSMSHQISN